MKIGIYPGSFDPITLGHLDVINRASKLVDKLIIGVLQNSAKKPLFTADERTDMIKQVTGHLDNVTVASYDGLLVDYAREQNATIIIRGLRAVTDFEYELQIAQTNHKLYNDVDTVFLTTGVEYSYVSSTLVKEIASYHGDISQFVPKEIIKKIEDKINA